jgi:hypothetical protein
MKTLILKNPLVSIIFVPENKKYQAGTQYVLSYNCILYDASGFISLPVPSLKSKVVATDIGILHFL